MDNKHPEGQINESNSSPSTMKNCSPEEKTGCEKKKIKYHIG
jgi:hypothetical protein